MMSPTHNQGVKKKEYTHTMVRGRTLQMTPLHENSGGSKSKHTRRNNALIAQDLGILQHTVATGSWDWRHPLQAQHRARRAILCSNRIVGF